MSISTPTAICHPERSEGPLHPLRLLTSKAFAACQLTYAVLREIFDESAYQRFLARHSLPSSRSAYKRFLREGELAQARRPRCC